MLETPCPRPRKRETLGRRLRRRGFRLPNDTQTGGYGLYTILSTLADRLGIRSPPDAIYTSDEDLQGVIDRRVTEILKMQRELRQKALNRIITEQERMKERYDYQRTAGIVPPLRVGEFALVHSETAGLGNRNGRVRIVWPVS